MPARKINFINGQIYHVFNKTIESKKIFDDNYLCREFLETILYYRSSKVRSRFSQYKILSAEIQNLILKEILNPIYFKVEILSYCLMQTHFHFLLKQLSENGISKFIGNTLNSFTRYFNIKFERKGPIFLPRFKAVLIKSEEQLKHVSRYIHLNPYSDGLIKSIDKLENYPWSSFKEYFPNSSQKLSNPDFILGLFNNDKLRYKKFVFDNADYQKSLEHIKHIDRW